MLGQWVIRPSDPANQHIILKIVGFYDFTVLLRKPISQIDIYAQVGGVCNPNTSSILNKLQLCK